MGVAQCKCRTCTEDSELTAIEQISSHVDRCLENLLARLFVLHDLNKNGFLEELELVQLNKKIAMLHHGVDVDTVAVKEKYQKIFRSHLDQGGEPVSYAIFRKYMLEVLGDIDSDRLSQSMILEQFIMEANLARAAFHVPGMQSISDEPFLGMISFDEGLPHSGFPAGESAPSVEAHLLSKSCGENVAGSNTCCHSPSSSPAVCGNSTCDSFGYASTSASAVDYASSGHFPESPASACSADLYLDFVPRLSTPSEGGSTECIEISSRLPLELDERIGPWL